jgi:hypothetical protein
LTQLAELVADLRRIDAVLLQISFELIYGLEIFLGIPMRFDAFDRVIERRDVGQWQLQTDAAKGT